MIGIYCFTGNYILRNKGAHIYNGNIFICKEYGEKHKTKKGLQNNSSILCQMHKMQTQQRLNKHKHNHSVIIIFFKQMNNNHLKIRNLQILKNQTLSSM